jgi:hypothetical protein
MLMSAARVLSEREQVGLIALASAVGYTFDAATAKAIAEVQPKLKKLRDKVLAHSDKVVAQDVDVVWSAAGLTGEELYTALVLAHKALADIALQATGARLLLDDYDGSDAMQAARLMTSQ